MRVEIDARVGGRYAFVERWDGVDVEHIGEYVEIDRPRRLVFTLSVDGSSPDRVETAITPFENGCELILTHEMSPMWAEFADRTRDGWTGILDTLAGLLDST